MRISTDRSGLYAYRRTNWSSECKIFDGKHWIGYIQLDDLWTDKLNFVRLYFTRYILVDKWPLDKVYHLQPSYTLKAAVDQIIECHILAKAGKPPREGSYGPQFNKWRYLEEHQKY